MGCRTLLFLSAAMALAGCRPSVDADTGSEEAHAATGRSDRAVSGKSEASREPAEVGMFRWSSGMQMGTFWAAVGNKSGDYLRFFSDDGEGWEPSIELANIQGIPTEGTINLVVGQEAEVFPYELVDGQPKILFLGMDGARSKLRLLDLLKGAVEPVCAEFPEAERRTCFSTSGIGEALF